VDFCDCPPYDVARLVPLSKEGVSIFGWIQKWTKTITPEKKKPDNFLHYTDISQPLPMASRRLSGLPLSGSDMRNFERSVPEIVQAVVSSRANGSSFRSSGAFPVRDTSGT
jgi:hypothetical protein